MKFYIKSFGCQYNEWDAARLSFVLNQFGLVESGKEKADLIFLLNCSVRKTGVDRVMSHTKNFVKAGKKVFVSGCVLENDKKIFLDHGAILWNSEDSSELKKLLNINLKELLSVDCYLSTSLVPITKGCNNFCSYCAVPYTRGREISRPIDEIISDAKRIIDNGGKEIILLGQNVNSYHHSSPLVILNGSEESPEKETGRSFVVTQDDNKNPRNDKGIGFSELLKSINNIPGDFIIKFTSNHPKDMSDEIIDAIATLPKVAKEIHLPLQSGSNKILKAMNRPYTKEQYLELVSDLKSTIKNIKLSTDTIVGFPGETEEDFQETVKVLENVGFAKIFNNKYSPRSGTVAFKLGDPIPWSEKERRWRILNEIAHKK